MPRKLLTIALVVLSQAMVVAAQESGADEKTRSGAPASDEQATPRRSIRVLQDPYDLASFYRAGGSAPDGWAGLTNDPSYAIAGFYRSQGARTRGRYGWSAFWTGGYNTRRPAPFPAYRRTIGENGDLFLVVPFLAPVGAISGAFFGY
jgi:hypothetical protein